ncbi:polyketide synthase type I [Chondrocystis sp. NIES-4102]|nr:polyketide synthase type I [Chondrocystis sp. NIES-4102]
MNNLTNLNLEDAIAIIGMDGRFPGAKNITEFWDNLKHGRESITHLSEQELLHSGVDKKTINNPNYVKAGAFLDDIDRFDASFFGYNPQTASSLDPQHRLFLESAYNALENAGYNPDNYPGKIGIFAGVGWNNYLLSNLKGDEDFWQTALGYQTVIGNDKDFLTTRISYLLNLKGISLDIQTACSTSLVATAMGCQSLLTYQSDMVLAGGVSIASLKKIGYLYQTGGILSPDGHCRAFDAQAQGTVPGSGVGVVVLKRLEDAIADGDCIHAIIRASAINNDGGDKVGYTAPSVAGQAEVIASALALAAVAPETITYIETHGTGTVLGDPIEIAALHQVFGDNGKIALGSVKTNIGHLDAAAGIAGLIKTVLALKHQQIPPSLHFQHPNPKIDFANSPFYVNTQLQAWAKGEYPRRAGVSSFGIGGTNVHLVLEEAPLTRQQLATRQEELLVISAKTETALETATTNLAAYLSQHPELDLADVAYTLQVGRKEYNYRRLIVGKDLQEMAIALANLDPQRVLTHCTSQQRQGITFMFPGQGSQYFQMGKELYATQPVFRQCIDRCGEILQAYLDLPLLEVLGFVSATSPNYINQTQYAQPAIFTIEYALAQLWISWGVKPQAAIGHSIGEYVAATIAGVFSLETALYIVAQRGKLVAQMPTGSMLAVSLSPTAVKQILDDRLSLAAINAPNLCVIAGEDQAIALCAKQLQQCRHLHTSHAFHSPMMDGAIAPLAEILAQVELHPPQMPFISCVTGTWITSAQATDPDYWAKHLRQTVCFAHGVTELLQDPDCILLEVGAGRTLSTFVRHNPNQATGQIVLSSLPHPQEAIGDMAFILNMLGRLWLAGVAIDWVNFSAPQAHARIPLPTYPFERQRYWLSKENVVKKKDLADWFYLPVWQALPLFPTPKQPLDPYLVFADQSSLSKEILQQLGNKAISVYQGEEYSFNNHQYTIDPENPADYQTLLGAIAKRSPEGLIANLDSLPTKIIYLWSVDYQGEQNFWHLIYLAQAIPQPPKHQIEIIVVTDNFYDVIGNETLSYTPATLLGAIVVIPQEYNYLSCRQIDLNQAESITLEQLITEFTTDTTAQFIAYRHRRRWVQSFEPVSLNTPSNSKLRQAGVYLITGGMGGIGLTLAKYLARRVQAKLILIGRSPLSSTQKLQDLEALGAEVLTLSADVCNYDSMQQAIAQTVSRFGTINGVIHCAGIPGGGMIDLKTPDLAYRVFAPKVTGTLVLKEVLSGFNLDFLLLCSSLTSIVGGLGQADYCGANAFLDAFARSRDHHYPTIAINWDTWQQVGMAYNTNVPQQHGLLPDEAVEVFERVINSGLSQVIVSTQDLTSAIAQSNDFLATYQNQTVSTSDQSVNDYVAPSNEIQLTIAKIWQEVIGLEKIGIYDNFFDLGGHSLLAVQVTSRLRETFNLDLPLRTVLLETPTIAQLAEVIEAKILAEIESLSAEEITRQLAQE